jgi:hypothetical protein
VECEIDSQSETAVAGIKVMVCETGVRAKVSTWGSNDIAGSTRKHVTLIKTKHGTRLNLGPDLILALKKIRASN